MALELRVKRLENILHPENDIPEGVLTCDDWTFEERWFLYSESDDCPQYLREKYARTDWSIPSRKKNTKKLEDFF